MHFYLSKITRALSTLMLVLGLLFGGLAIVGCDNDDDVGDEVEEAAEEAGDEVEEATD